ncbi:MAG: hypothetical protein Q9184_005385 [Pyrenodesmia sp. 2 TL-2023]
MTNAKPPSPISWAPSQWWDGDDGDWSSFDLRVGDPEQTVRVLPSTAGSAIWIVTPGGCDPPSSECSESRGWLFNQSQSNTWEDLGPFTLGLEQNLGHNESGAFGLDTISLGLTNATGGPTLNSQVIAGIETEHWYIGLFGLQQQPTNLTNFSQPRQSFLSTLRAQNLIPSLSWSYTAGAHYQSKGSFGSLTFGGSDVSKYAPSNVSFTLAQDVARDLVVGIQSITTTYVNNSVSSLLQAPTLAFIDSTVPYIYLPEDACKAFESELGLVYNEENNIYFVDDALHQKLLNLQPQFTFRLGNDKISKPTVEITLPYASFDLVIKPPLQPNTTLYFPLRRGADNQITLGRAFLQEAYLITDYDHNNFTVAQALFNENTKTNIVPIPWNATAAPDERKSLSRQATIGIGTGSTIFALLVVMIIFFCAMRRRKHQAMIASADTSTTSQNPPDVRPPSFIPTQEIGHQSIPELHDMAYHLELLDGQVPSGSGNEINELPNGDEISRCEPSAPATPSSNLLSLRGRNASSTRTRRHESRSLEVHDIRASVTSNPSSEINVRRITFTESHNFTSQASSKEYAKSLSHTPLMAHINKALPLLPSQRSHRRQDESSHPSLPVTPISESFQVSPAVYAISKGPITKGHEPVVLSPRPSPLATYSTIFDIDEYRDPTGLIGVEITRQLDALTKDGNSQVIVGRAGKRRGGRSNLAIGAIIG